MLSFSDGIKIDTSGELRHLLLDDGDYVVGEGMLIPVNSLEECNQMIEKLKAIKSTE